MTSILEKFNVGGFRWLNDLAAHWAWLDWFMIFAADKMGYLLILFVLIIFWKKDHFKRAVLVSLGSAIVARLVFVAIFRYLVYSPRPFMILERVNILMNHQLESSFPSGHASFYFALATGAYFYNKKAGRILLVLAGLMGLARIFVSIHWPLDILAGAVLGWATALMINKVSGRFLKKKQ